MVFSGSKIPEFVDTFFMILRGKKVPLLHWVHHATVSPYSYWLYTLRASTGIIFQAMNCTVHSIMYFYYLLSDLGVNVRPVAIYITTLQILQMVAGTAVCAWGVYQHLVLGDTSCPTPLRAHAWGLAMYLLYFVLFADFFIKRYIKKTADKKALDHGKNKKKQ